MGLPARKRVPADPTPLDLVGDPARAAGLLHPLRRRVLASLAEPGSATTVAATLGLPRQRVNYHLRALEEAGFVEQVGERKRGNCTERLVRATARAFLVDPTAVGLELAPSDQIEDRVSSSYQIAAAARAIRELAEVRARAERAGKPIATLTIEADVRFATPAARQAFADDLARAVAETVAKHHDGTTDGGRSFRLLVGLRPAITKPESEKSDQGDIP